MKIQKPKDKTLAYIRYNIVVDNKKMQNKIFKFAKENDIPAKKYRYLTTPFNEVIQWSVRANNKKDAVYLRLIFLKDVLKVVKDEYNYS